MLPFGIIGLIEIMARDRRSGRTSDFLHGTDIGEGLHDPAQAREATIFDTEMALYPRVDITQAGLAPLTSMYMFDANDRTGADDWRPAVHDSLGLELRTGRDERIWRPLTNPRELQVSAFGDHGPRGFGLMQRKRALGDFEDLESRYEKRPSLWAVSYTHLTLPTNREV